MNSQESSLVGVVLAGAGARGAYEAGALATLLPVLEAHGRRPKIFVGTSAGAINAVLFASLAHLPAREAAEKALAMWRRVGRKEVIRSIVLSGIEAAGRYAGQLLGVPIELTSMLDPTPLHTTLNALLDWQQLHDNAARPEVLQGVAVTATDCISGRTKVFVECARTLRLPATDDSRAIDYVGATLDSRHVMASAAIPVIFPPMLIKDPIESQGWYLDGGVRLNAPIKPAIALGAERLVLVATDPILQMQPSSKVGPEPDVRAALADVLHAMLVDRMVEDVLSLDKVNELLQHCHEASTLFRSRQGLRPYRTIPYVFAGPGKPGELAMLANRVFHARYGNWRWLQHSLDFPVLHRLLGGSGKVNGELLSYFFFEREFMEAAVALGQREARRLIDKTAGLYWRTETGPPASRKSLVG